MVLAVEVYAVNFVLWTIPLAAPEHSEVGDERVAEDAA
jgi:hypothetical protein